MLYRKFKPPEHLASFLECFYIWEAEFSDGPFVVESPPNGFASIVFNYHRSYQILNPKSESLFINAPQSFITGQATKSYQLRLEGKIGMVGIVFRPSAISSIFGLPMYEFVDTRHDLIAVLGKELSFIEEELQECTTHEGKIEILVNFIESKLSKGSLKTSRIDYAADLIVSQNGNVNLMEIIEDMFVCRRQFERQFFSKVGISPGYYSRVRKISHLCKTMATQKWNIDDWHQLIVQYGYYDQAHFIKEFKGFMGRSPSFYLKNNQELARYLDA